MGGLRRTFGFGGVLVVSAGAGVVALACGHLPMEQLPVEEDALTADGGNTASSSSSSGSVDRDADVSGDGGQPGDGDAGDVPDGDAPDSGLPNCATSNDPRCDPRTLFVRGRPIDDDDEPAPDGSFRNPYGTITDALAHVTAATRRIWIANGDYRETPLFAPNIEYKGGFVCVKDPCAWVDRVVGTRIHATTAEGIVMRELAAQTTFDTLEFYGVDDLPAGGFVSQVTTLTLEDSAGLFFQVNINPSKLTSASKAVGLSIVGARGAGPELKNSSVDAGTATHHSVGIELAKSATSLPKLKMLGGSVSAGSADLSVAVHVLGGATVSTLLEGVEVTAGRSLALFPATGEAASWGISVHEEAGIEVRQSKINNPSALPNDANVPGGKLAYCATGQNFCGGIRSERSDLLVRSSWVGGLPAVRSAAIMLVDQPPSGGANAIINGNTLDGGGGPFATAALPAEKKSAAIVVRSVNGAMRLGRVRNTILGSGANTSRYNVYEDGTPARQAHLEKLENNAYYFRGGSQDAWAYHASSNGKDYTYLDMTGNAVIDPVPLACVSAAPVFRTVAGHPPVFLATDAALNPKIVNGGAFDGEAYARDYNGDQTRPRGEGMEIGADELP